MQYDAYESVRDEFEKSAIGKEANKFAGTNGDFESGKIVREREKATNALSKKPQVAKKAQLVLVQTGSSRRPKSADALSSLRLPHEVTSSTKKVTSSTKTGNEEE